MFMSSYEWIIPIQSFIDRFSVLFEKPKKEFDPAQIAMFQLKKVIYAYYCELIFDELTGFLEAFCDSDTNDFVINFDENIMLEKFQFLLAAQNFKVFNIFMTEANLYISN